MKPHFFLVCSSIIAWAAQAHAQQLNYPDKRDLIANVSSDLKIDSFVAKNVSADAGERFEQDVSWENTGQKEIVAFELVVLKYDPFNEPLVGSRTIFPGHNSANYSHLKPGDKDSDGFSSFVAEDTFTAIVYVREIRFGDGTVWKANPADVLASIKSQAKDIVEPGNLAPDKPKSGSPG